MMKLEEIGTRARQAEPVLRIMETEKKNRVLKKAAENLVADAETIIAANALDMEHGKEKGMSQGLLDRLFLDKSRIEAMAEGMCQVSELDDPIGEVLGMKKRPNGLLIGQKRVPLGVVGIIYEARPNVTADAFALCFKTGNVVILKGGSDAIHSNTAIVASLRKTLKEEQVPEDALLLIEDTSRETTAQFMKMNRYVDVLIPRGGAGLIRAVVENSTIPVIETGTGNCHIYVDETADLSMAVDIILNAKTQRVGVCNACESIVVHENVREKLLPVLEERLKEKHVEMRADEKAREYMPEAEEATEEDWGKEYLDYIVSIKNGFLYRRSDRAHQPLQHKTLRSNHHQQLHPRPEIPGRNRCSCSLRQRLHPLHRRLRIRLRRRNRNQHPKTSRQRPNGLLALTSIKNIVYGTGQIRK